MEEKVIKDYGWSRGEEAENKVCLALEELRNEGMIKDFGQSFRFSQEDASGRDFVITTNEGKIIWLQVKSGFNENDKKKYLRRGIHYLAVGQKTLGRIKKEILGIVKQEKKSSKAKSQP